MLRKSKRSKVSKRFKRSKRSTKKPLLIVGIFTIVGGAIGRALMGPHPKDDYR